VQGIHCREVESLSSAHLSVAGFTCDFFPDEKSDGERHSAQDFSLK
jgi:hypothetical protein